MLLRASTALAVTFAPTVTDLSLVPGETGQADFTIENSASVSKKYIVSMYDVTLSQSLESPVFSPLSEERSAWLSLDTYGFTLAPGASRMVLLEAAPPLDVTADSFVIGLVVRELAEDNVFAVTSGVTSLVFVTVGSPETRAVVTSFDMSPRISARYALDVTTTIVNNGARVLQPYGTVVVTNTFGRQVAEVNINPALGRIPPGDVRTFATSVGEAARRGFLYELWREVVEHRVGIFTAKLVAAPYPGAAATLTASSRVFVFPWRLALVLGVTGSAIILARRRR